MAAYTSGLTPRPETRVTTQSGLRHDHGRAEPVPLPSDTVSPTKTVHRHCIQAGLSKFLVQNVPYEKVPGYLGCADLGITGIPPTPSMCFRSPIKNGEYWAAGLPVISYSGVGDDAELIRRERIGVIVEDPSPGSWRQCAEELETLLALDRKQLAARCRRAAQKHRNVHHGVAVFLKGLRQVTG